MEDALPPLPKGRGFCAGNRMKLISARHKDRTDIIELLKVWGDLSSIENFVKKHIPQRFPMLEHLEICAEEEK